MTGAYRLAAGVVPLVLEAVLARHGRGDLELAGGQDRAAVLRELGVADAAVLRPWRPAGPAGTGRCRCRWPSSSPNISMATTATRRIGPFTRPAPPGWSRGPAGTRSAVGDRAADLVGDDHEQADDDPVADHRRAALRHERGRQAGQRQQPGDAADDREDLQGEGERQAGGQQLAEGLAALQRGAQAARHEQPVDQDHGHQPGHAELLADRRGDEVAPGQRRQARAAEPEAGAEQAAVREPELRADHLVVGVEVAERVQPGADPDAHVAEVQVAEVGPGREEQHPEHRPAGAFGRDVEHHHEQPEEEQRGAEVALQDQDRQAQQPDQHDRAEVAGAGQVDAEHAVAGQGQHVALLHQVGGEGDGQQDLGGLGGLEAVGPELDPDAGAELRRPDPGGQRAAAAARRRRARSCTCSAAAGGGRAAARRRRRRSRRRGRSRSAAGGRRARPGR